MWPFKQRWNPDGLHCYVTGGSQGLGLALSKILVQRGAHVTIVARTEERLKAAVAELETARQSLGQKLNYVCHALNTAEEADLALTEACSLFDGRAPDAIFNCAGFATPGYFLEMTPAELEAGMTNAYWLQLWTAHAGAKRMVKDGVKGKIVFVSSTAGLVSLIGYASYAPGKFALRALGETLRTEFLLYEIDVHTFFPCTMETPGYQNELLTKPELQKKIEEMDKGITPEEAALGLLRGIDNGEFHIAVDFLTNMFRASARGAAPKNNFIVDAFYDLISFIAMPFVIRSVEKLTVAHRQKHREYLASKGF